MLGAHVDPGRALGGAGAEGAQEALGVGGGLGFKSAWSLMAWARVISFKGLLPMAA